MSGLFPGYKHVESFGLDDLYDDEVEECYVTLDLGNVEQTLIPSSSTYRLIGLDTPTPFLQLSGTILKGTHQTLLGTELLFGESGGDDDEASAAQHGVQHYASSERRIRFTEVELKPKNESKENEEVNKWKNKWKGATDAPPVLQEGVAIASLVAQSQPAGEVGAVTGTEPSIRPDKGKGRTIESELELEGAISFDFADPPGMADESMDVDG